MNTGQQLVIYRLAHENNMPVDRFLDRLQEAFHIDTSDYPKTPEGDIIYPDGKIGLELQISNDEELEIHMAAQKIGVTTNQFIEDAVRHAYEKAKAENPEAFKDIDD